jgi:hypothetical protein
VGVHGLRTNHFGRRIISLNTNYFVMSRCYICNQCKEDCKKLKQQIQRAAVENNVEVQIGLRKPSQYTFMAWNKKSLELYPHGYGDAFPAFLTWQGTKFPTILPNQHQ